MSQIIDFPKNESKRVELSRTVHERLCEWVREEQTLLWLEKEATVFDVNHIINTTDTSMLQQVVNDVKSTWSNTFSEIDTRHPVTDWLVTISYRKDNHQLVSAHYSNSVDMVTLSKYVRCMLQADIDSSL